MLLLYYYSDNVYDYVDWGCFHYYYSFNDFGKVENVDDKRNNGNDVSNIVIILVLI